MISSDTNKEAPIEDSTAQAHVQPTPILRINGNKQDVSRSESPASHLPVFNSDPHLVSWKTFFPIHRSHAVNCLIMVTNHRGVIIPATQISSSPEPGSRAATSDLTVTGLRRRRQEVGKPTGINPPDYTDLMRGGISRDNNLTSKSVIEEIFGHMRLRSYKCLQVQPITC